MLNAKGDMDANKVLKFLKLERLTDHLSGYIEDRVELFKLELKEDAIKVGVKIFFIVLMLLMAAFFVLFVSFALAILINQALDHSYVGYLIIAGAYLVMTLITYGLRDNRAIQNVIYKVINKSQHD